MVKRSVFFDFRLTFVLVLALSASGCMTAYKKSVGGEGPKTFIRIYLTDFNTAWQSVGDSLKSFRIDVSNREGGFYQTRWTDNTAEKNFIESYAGATSFLKAQFRFKIVLTKGLYNGKDSVKISVLKEQLIQRDVLDGWRPVDTDDIEENTLLYRIGRLITMRMRMAKIDELKQKEELKANPEQDPSITN